VLITYILFLTKLQKKANPMKWICPIKNDITGSESTVRMLDT
jgi:hypothetical protein